MSSKNFLDFEKIALDSGLAWKVEKRPLFDDRGNKLPVFGTFRSDNSHYLGTVREGYHEFQNIDLLRLPESLQRAGTEVSFIRAGEMNGGERVFAEFALPFSFNAGNVGDIVSSSLVASARHDGRGSVITHVNLRRKVCTNGMTMPVGYALQYARHDSALPENIKGIQATLIRAGEDVKNFGVLASRLAKITLTTENIRDIVTKVFHESDTNNIYTNERAQNKARAILSIFDANDNDEFKKQRGTAWNLLNAFTNYADHRENYRSSNGETAEQARARGALFGAGHALKWHALAVISQVAGKAHGLEIPSHFESVLSEESAK